MPEKTKKELFYEQGLRFACQGSGKCCTSHGEFSFVYLTREDRKRMAEHLGLSENQFKKTYCTKTQGIWHLNEEAGRPDCIFLKNRQCSVYEARPNQCRTWPFWPEVMNAKAWKTEVADFCPGVGKGRLWTKDEIEDSIRRDKENEQTLLRARLGE